MKDSNWGKGHFIARIPKSCILKTGKFLGICLYLLDKPHRRLVRRNLQFCYPEWSVNDIRKMSRQIFKHTGITIIEILQSPFLSCEDLLTGFRFVSGEQYFIDALKDTNKGLIVAACHMGNWEVGLPYFGCIIDRPLTAVARKIGIKWLDDWFDFLRTRLGNKIIYKRSSA